MTADQVNLSIHTVWSVFTIHLKDDHNGLVLKKPTDLDLHCLSLSMWICIDNLDQIIWLAES